jgi:hypothetical protein
MTITEFKHKIESDEAVTISEFCWFVNYCFKKYGKERTIEAINKHCTIAQ